MVACLWYKQKEYGRKWENELMKNTLIKRQNKNFSLNVNFRRKNEKKKIIFCSTEEKRILRVLFRDRGLYEISDLISISPPSRALPICSSQTSVTGAGTVGQGSFLAATLCPIEANRAGSRPAEAAISQKSSKRNKRIQKSESGQSLGLNCTKLCHFSAALLTPVKLLVLDMLRVLHHSRKLKYVSWEERICPKIQIHSFKDVLGENFSLMPVVLHLYGSAPSYLHQERLRTVWKRSYGKCRTKEVLCIRNLFSARTGGCPRGNVKK